MRARPPLAASLRPRPPAAALRARPPLAASLRPRLLAATSLVPLLTTLVGCAWGRPAPADAATSARRAEAASAPAADEVRAPQSGAARAPGARPDAHAEAPREVTGQASKVAAPPAGDAKAPSEANVRPGANVEYLKPEMRVEEWAARFERAGRDIYERRFDLVQATGVRRGGVVADVGAGTGLFTLLFAEAVGPEGRVYAVDIAPKFVAHIERRAAALGRKNVVAVLGDERGIGLAAASVDVAFLCDVYHHFEYPRNMLASIRRALRPGGRLIVVDFERVPGKSASWIVEHVRAGKRTFRTEIEAAGFAFVRERPPLRENYVLEFQAPGATL